MSRKRSMPAAAVFVLLLVPGCSEPLREPTPEPPAALPSPVLVSEARARAIDATNPGASAVAYVALPPGSLPTVTTISIRNRGGSDPAMPVLLVDGGIDPVPVPAVPGDELELTLTYLSGAQTIAVARVPARRPPVVVRTYPTQGRTDVALNVVPTLIFSEPIDSGTLRDGVRLLRGEEELDLEMQVTGTRPWEVRIAPAAELDPGATYELRISVAVRDLDGDALESPLSVGFTTAGASAPLPVAVAPMAFTRANYIFIAPGDGSMARALQACSAGAPFYPRISPDGTRVLALINGMGGGDVCVAEADGSGEYTLGIFSMASWSPDGTRIVYLDQSGLNTMKADGTDRELLLGSERLPSVDPGAQTTSFLDWAANGSIAFSWRSGGAGTSQIWLVQDDGTGLRRVGDANTSYRGPNLSPDGARIAYVIYQLGDSGNWAGTSLESMTADGSDPRVHYRSGGTNLQELAFDWSPDGRHIAFTREDGAIHVVDVETGAVSVLLASTYMGYGDDNRSLSWAAGRP